MKNLIVFSALSICLVLGSCNSTGSDRANDEKENELLRKELELAKKELELSKQEAEQEAKEIVKQDEVTQTVDVTHDIHDDPVTLVEAIFLAARTGNFSELSGLCEPSGAGDGDTKRICDIASQPKAAQDDFKSQFQKGRVVGNAILFGDNGAKVKIKFGPDGTRDEEFDLTKISGKWYIVSF